MFERAWAFPLVPSGCRQARANRREFRTVPLLLQDGGAGPRHVKRRSWERLRHIPATERGGSADQPSVPTGRAVFFCCLLCIPFEAGLCGHVRGRRPAEQGTTAAVNQPLNRTMPPTSARRRRGPRSRGSRALGRCARRLHHRRKRDGLSKIWEQRGEGCGPTGPRDGP